MANLLTKENRETAIKFFKRHMREDNLRYGERQAIHVALSALTIEAEPVKHGRWIQVICHIEFEDGFVDVIKECCSECHIPNGKRMTNYCPNCGANMDMEG